MDKIYIRKGRRFVSVPNVVGMFYDGDEFTKERTPTSYAFCYNQNGNTAMLVLLNAENGEFTWHEAQEAFVKLYHLPSREQILLVRTKYKSLFNGSFLANNIIWTRDVVESYSYYAWYLIWDDGDVDCSDKRYVAKVLLFFETEVI